VYRNANAALCVSRAAQVIHQRIRELRAQGVSIAIADAIITARIPF